MRRTSLLKTPSRTETREQKNSPLYLKEKEGEDYILACTSTSVTHMLNRENHSVHKVFGDIVANPRYIEDRVDKVIHDTNLLLGQIKDVKYVWSPHTVRMVVSTGGVIDNKENGPKVKKSSIKGIEINKTNASNKKPFSQTTPSVLSVNKTSKRNTSMNNTAPNKSKNGSGSPTSSSTQHAYNLETISSFAHGRSCFDLLGVKRGSGQKAFECRFRFPQIVLKVMSNCITALHEVYAKGVPCHGNIKPNNILLNCPVPSPATDDEAAALFHDHYESNLKKVFQHPELSALGVPVCTGRENIALICEAYLSDFNVPGLGRPMNGYQHIPLRSIDSSILPDLKVEDVALLPDFYHEDEEGIIVEGGASNEGIPKEIAPPPPSRSQSPYSRYERKRQAPPPPPRPPQKANTVEDTVSSVPGSDASMLFAPVNKPSLPPPGSDVPPATSRGRTGYTEVKENDSVGKEKGTTGAAKSRRKSMTMTPLEYYRAVDVWSLASSMIALGVGVFIDRKENVKQMKKRLWSMDKEYTTWNSEQRQAWQSIPLEVKDMLLSMLQVDPAQRVTIDTLYHSPFLAAYRERKSLLNLQFHISAQGMVIDGMSMNRILLERDRVEKLIPPPDQTVIDALFETCRNGEHEKLRDLLHYYRGNKAMLNTYDKAGKTALIYACSRGTFDCVRYLLRYGADPLLCTKTHDRALLFAISHGFADCVEAIVDQVGVNTYANERRWWTPLHVACYYNQLEIVRLLLNKGAKHSMRDVSGKCAINYCEVKIPPSSPDYFHEKGVAKEITATLKKYIASSKIPAMIGGKGSDIDIRAGEGNRNAEEYVEGRAAPSSQDRGVAKAELELSSLQSQHHELIGRVEDEQTLLYATQVREMCKPVPPNVGVRLREYAETGNSKQLEILLEKYKGNVVINEKDNGHGVSALHCAARHGFDEIVHMLINYGCDLFVREHYGGLPLHYAVHNGHSSTTRILLEAMAHASSPGKSAHSTLQEVQSQVSIQGIDDFYPSIMCPESWTCLHSAVNQGNEDLIDLLLQYGANTDIMNMQKVTAKASTTNFRLLQVFHRYLDTNGTLNLGGSPRRRGSSNASMTSISREFARQGSDYRGSDTPSIHIPEHELLAITPTLAGAFPNYNDANSNASSPLISISRGRNEGYTNGSNDGSGENKGDDYDDDVPSFLTNLHIKTERHNSVTGTYPVSHGGSSNESSPSKVNTNRSLSPRSMTPLINARRDSVQTPVALNFEEGGHLHEIGIGKGFVMQNSPVQKLQNLPFTSEERSLAPKKKSNPNDNATSRIVRSVSRTTITWTPYTNDQTTDLSMANKNPVVTKTPCSFICDAVASNRVMELRMLMKYIEKEANIEWDIDTLSSNGRSALHDAACRGFHECMGILIQNQANINIRGCNANLTPLHVAVNNRRYKCVLLLLDNGAEIDAIDDLGETALHKAMRINARDCIATLVEQGSNVKAKSKAGKTPMESTVLLGAKACLKKALQKRGWT